jgi:hypothetical protein
MRAGLGLTCPAAAPRGGVARQVPPKRSVSSGLRSALPSPYLGLVCRGSAGSPVAPSSAVTLELVELATCSRSSSGLPTELKSQIGHANTIGLCIFIQIDSFTQF